MRRSAVITIVVCAVFGGRANADGGLPRAGLNSGLRAQNLGQTPAWILLTLYAADGTSYDCGARSVAPRDSTTFLPRSDCPVPPGFVGSAVVTADQPVATMVDVNNKPLGTAGGQYRATSQDELATSVYFPLVGCRDSVYSTPALGDLDNDADLEVIFGSFDKRIYAVHHDGRLVQGFPPASYHYQQTGWPNLQHKLADTIHSSPALADIDGDGHLDVILGTDEGNFWDCPYLKQPGSDAPDYCGGALYGVARDGSLLEGFPRYILESMASIPAVVDVDGDGGYEIFVGTGTFHHHTSPDHPTYGFRFYGWDHQARDLPGWSGGKATDETVPASPAVGDIAGDSAPEIVVQAFSGRLYAWHHHGGAVAGFPMTPRTREGASEPFGMPRSPVLADVDGDGKMEILVSVNHYVVMVAGDGQQLTASNGHDDPRPYYHAAGLLKNNPAVGDIDGDGALELVVSNTRVTVWDLDPASTRADWPMHKHNAARTSSCDAPRVSVIPAAITRIVAAAAAEPLSAHVVLRRRAGASSSISWSVKATMPSRVSLEPSQGTLALRQVVRVSIRTSGLSIGQQDLGLIEVRASSDGAPIDQSPWRIPVRSIVAPQVFSSHAPLVARQ